MSALSIRTRSMLRKAPASNQNPAEISERLECEAKLSAESFSRSFDAKFLQEKLKNISCLKLKCNPKIVSRICLKSSKEPAISTTLSIPADEGSVLTQPVKTLNFKFLKNTKVPRSETRRSVQYGKQFACTFNKVLHAQFSLTTDHQIPALSATDNPSLHKKQFSIMLQNTSNNQNAISEITSLANTGIPACNKDQNKLLPVGNLDPSPVSNPSGSPVSNLGSPDLRSVSLSKFLNIESNTGIKKGTSNMKMFYNTFSIRNDSKSVNPSLKQNGKFSSKNSLRINMPTNKLENDPLLETSSRKVSFSKNILIYRYTTDKLT